MYRWGIRRGPLPRNTANPFSDAGLSRLKIRDAKPIFTFSEEQELQFFIAASPWAFTVHAILAKTGMRPGELVHLLIEDVDIKGGWLNVCGKPELGWSLKAGHDRRIPLVPEVMGLIKWMIGIRRVGPLLLRERLNSQNIFLFEDRDGLRRVADERLARAREKAGSSFTRADAARTLKSIWRDAGATKEDRIRNAFIRAAKAAGLKATCPKSWRHTFATLLQEAHVDVLVRQLTLGHKPAAPG